MLGVEHIRISELNVVNTNAGMKKEKRNQPENESGMIDLIEEIVILNETEKMTIDIAVTMTKIKRSNRENERGTAINLQRI